MKNKENIAELLNLNYLKYLNKAASHGYMDLPAISCSITVFPDYIALYKQKGLYNKAEHTAVAFFQYDKDFDGKYGLFWAIYYQADDRLKYFKNALKV